MLAAGLIVPVLAIDDAGYEIIVRGPGEPHPLDASVVHRNPGFALRITGRALITDLYSLIDWSAPASAEYVELDLAPGTYRVDVDAFSRHVPGEGIVSAGYIVTCTPEPTLPPITADTGAYMRVFDQPGAGPTGGRDSASAARADARRAGELLPRPRRTTPDADGGRARPGEAPRPGM